MKKRVDKAMILMMAAALSASALSACGAGAAETAAAQTAAVQTEAASGETAAETKAEDAETGEDAPAAQETGEAETYIELQPVAKWGYITKIDEATGDISFNSNEYAVDGQGDYSDTVNEIVLKTTADTPVLDGMSLAPVALSEIDTAQPVYVWTAQAMTMSIPPQTTAQAIIVNVPQDASAPMYVVAQQVKTGEDGSIVITDQDGVAWRADVDTEVTPYLTRNIVTLEDIHEGTRLVISQGSETSTSGSSKAGEADAYAARILVFAE